MKRPPTQLGTWLGRCAAGGIAAGVVTTAAALAKQDQGGSIPCGPGCGAIACRLLGMDIDNESLARLADDRGETSMKAMADYFQSIGLHSLVVRTTPAVIERAPCLAILQLRTPPGAASRHHFTVSAGGTSSGGFYVLDPLAANGRGEIRAESLINKWTGAAVLVSRSPIRVKADRAVAWARGGAVVAGALCAAFLAAGIARRRRVRCDAGPRA